MSDFPRWRLTNPHYINVVALADGTKVEWEHKETSRETGRAIRKLFAVPALLDPRDPADHNYPGEIIVARDVEGAHNSYCNDIIFLGDPTPEMEPLNDEAQAITDTCRPRWEHPIDTLPANGGMSSQEQAFMQTMMAGFAKEIGVQLQGNKAIGNDEVTDLKERLAKLEALLAAQAKPTEAPQRRA